MQHVVPANDFVRHADAQRREIRRMQPRSLLTQPSDICAPVTSASVLMGGIER
jgi:hypothetical protein